MSARPRLKHSVVIVVKAARALKQIATSRAVLQRQKLAAIPSATAVKASLKRGVKVIADPKHQMPASAHRTSSVMAMRIIAHAVHGMAR